MARWTCVQHKKKVDDDNRFENEMEIRVRLHLEEVSHKYGKDLRSNSVREMITSLTMRIHIMLRCCVYKYPSRIKERNNDSSSSSQQKAI